MVRRGREPGRGLWSVPGGRVEAGESDVTAVEREVLEETGLHVSVGLLVGTVVRDGPAQGFPGVDRRPVKYDVRDYACAVLGPTSPVPGDDADEVRWVTRRELSELALVDRLWETLSGWGVLPR